MYLTYMSNWILKVMSLPVPLVLFKDIVVIVSIYQIFFVMVLLSVFIILIKFLITDSFSWNSSKTDTAYSSDNNSVKSENYKVRVKLSDTMAGRIIRSKYKE